MRNPATFIRSYDRPLPASILWLGAVALCVKGEIDWTTIAFQCVACEDFKEAAYVIGSLRAFDASEPLAPKLPLHWDGSEPPADFTGFVVLGGWNLEELRAARLRAARAEIAHPAPGLIDSAMAAFKGASSPWLAMSQEDGGAVDRLVYARDASHAAKLALDLPGRLCGLMPLDQLVGYVQKLEAAANAEKTSPAALHFHHRTAEEGEIELQEFIANHPRSEESQVVLDAVLNGGPLPSELFGG